MGHGNITRSGRLTGGARWVAPRARQRRAMLSQRAAHARGPPLPQPAPAMAEGEALLRMQLGAGHGRCGGESPGVPRAGESWRRRTRPRQDYLLHWRRAVSELDMSTMPQIRHTTAGFGPDFTAAEHGDFKYSRCSHVQRWKQQTLARTQHAACRWLRLGPRRTYCVRIGIDSFLYVLRVHA